MKPWVIFGICSSHGKQKSQQITLLFICEQNKNTKTGENTIPWRVIISGMAFYWQNRSAGKYLQWKQALESQNKLTTDPIHEH